VPAQASTPVPGAPWRVAPGDPVDLSSIDTGATPDMPGDRQAVEEDTDRLHDRLGELQTRLIAEGKQSLLLILQGMDASGKDGAVKSVAKSMNPMGVSVVSFKAPSDEERAHDFLWRVHQHVPPAGKVGVFNRSHYEDVLVVRVMDLQPEEAWRPRFDRINEFERLLTDRGTRVVKVMPHISRDEQAARFRERLTKPTKRWKFNADDLEHRARWDRYMAAYEDAIARTSTEHAPWFVVPADRKWYRNWAIARILVETLAAMNPRYPDRPDLEGISVI
jgi:PPK2 family polyphosphate:nucleotide phosphotransferase